MQVAQRIDVRFVEVDAHNIDFEKPVIHCMHNWLLIMFFGIFSDPKTQLTPKHNSTTKSHCKVKQDS